MKWMLLIGCAVNIALTIIKLTQNETGAEVMYAAYAVMFLMLLLFFRLVEIIKGKP